MEETVNSGAGCQLLTVAKEMKDGRGSQQSVDKLTSLETSDVFYPHLHSTVNVDVITQSVRHFMGSVEKAERTADVNDVTVVERFRCGEEKDIEVYSLCPKSNCNVMVSYARRGNREDAPSEEFDEMGKLVQTDKKATGKVSWKSCRNGRAMYPVPDAGRVRTYNKSQTQTHLRLRNNLSGQADIWRVKVTSEDPLKTESTKEFSIKVGAHRAHDVDASEQLLAVVEEGQAPDLQRKVRMFRRPREGSIFSSMFRRPQEDAVATYSPATAAFQPSDVCFYKLGGQQVLLVADELGDSIHVVNVQDDTMNFVRYLAPDCPLLVQPTALNVDHKGRLWVACRGGHILTMEPTA